MSMTLNTQQIIALATFAGLRVSYEDTDVNEEFLNSEYTLIEDISLLDEDTGEREHFNLGVFVTDYPEEGTMPLCVDWLLSEDKEVVPCTSVTK